MNLPKVMLLNQSHLVNHDVVMLLWEFRKPRLVTIKPHDEQKSSATYSSAKFDRFAEEKALGLCLHCRKKVIESATVPSDGQDKNRKMFQCS